MHNEARRFVHGLDLRIHPEGGWFRETYRSGWQIPASALPPGYNGPRVLGTSILFLLADDQVSRLHRLRGDELWHHHAGGSLDLHLFWPPDGRAQVGRYEHRGLGLDLARGRMPQVMVPAGCWFGATLANPTGFALTGCTMAPGFDFADFDLAAPGDLQRAFPERAELIARLS